MTEINNKGYQNYNDMQCIGRYPNLTYTPFPLPPTPGCDLEQFYTPDAYSFGGENSKYYKGEIGDLKKHHTGKALGITALVLGVGAFILSKGKFKPKGKGTSLLKEGWTKLANIVKHPVASAKKAVSFIKGDLMENVVKNADSSTTKYIKKRGKLVKEITKSADKNTGIITTVTKDSKNIITNIKENGGKKIITEIKDLQGNVIKTITQTTDDAAGIMRSETKDASGKLVRSIQKQIDPSTNSLKNVVVKDEATGQVVKDIEGVKKIVQDEAGKDIEIDAIKIKDGQGNVLDIKDVKKK